MRDGKSKAELVSTGIETLDDILGGGFPGRSIVVIAGEPGSGKTVLTLQMLFHAARQGKKCLYFTTLSEPAIKLVRYVQMFDFFDVKLLDQHIVFKDLGSVLRQGVEPTMAAIQDQVEALEPDFVVIDSFKAMAEVLGGQSRRNVVYDLSVQMAAWGATCLLLGEYVPSDFASHAEFAVADGIVRLGSERHELTSVREIEVLKMRGAAQRTGKHFFEIDHAGVAFYPRVSAPADIDSAAASRTSPEPVATGIAGLDELIAGGIPRGSTTVLQGSTGNGKTLLSLQFLLEGCRRGEKGVMFTLEETPAQLRSIALGFGWDLAALEAAGQLLIRYYSPVELSTDRLLHDARRCVEALGARRAVFDSVSTMSLGVPSERRFKEMVYAIAKHMRKLDVTLFMTLESEQIIGTSRLSGQGISFLADNLIQMRYVEIQGRLERSISVIKARGVKHDSELRAFNITSSGLEVIPGRFKNMRGVLTGQPSILDEELR